MKLLDGRAHGDKRGAERARRLKAGTVLVREYQDERHTVTVAPDGFPWRDSTYKSLTTIARAITGHRLERPALLRRAAEPRIARPRRGAGNDPARAFRAALTPGWSRHPLLARPREGATMKPSERKVFRCAIYTRKSTEHNLDLEFNSLDAGQIP
jgi:hypothetical protein